MAARHYWDMYTLAQYLADKGITQAEFADCVGVGQPTVSKLAAGKMPSLRLAQRIEDATSGAVSVRSWGDNSTPPSGAFSARRHQSDRSNP